MSASGQVLGEDTAPSERSTESTARLLESSVHPGPFVRRNLSQPSSQCKVLLTAARRPIAARAGLVVSARCRTDLTLI